MNTMKILESVAKSNSGIITNDAASRENISRETLSYLCKNEKLIRIAAGQYIMNDGLADELYSISLRTDNIVFSHETALFLHGLSDRTPFVHSITAQYGKLPSASLRKACKLYTIKSELFEMGLTTVKTQYGNEVRVYDIERTICDVVRSRSRVGTETFLSAVKSYSARSDKNLILLSEYAKKLRVDDTIRTYLEVLI